MLIALITLSALVTGCADTPEETSETTAATSQQIIKDITSVEAYALIVSNQSNTDFVIIDVRTPQEFAEGHIENAVNIDFNSISFEEDINNLDKDKKYLIYCRTSRRRAGARDIMRELDFREVYHMTGGIEDWEGNEFPVVK